jgi:ABC-2 type transport system permease protein
MKTLPDMLWIELRKAVRSRMPLWTSLGSLFMPLGIAFLLFVAKNLDISRRLGLVSAKASLVAYAATDWSTYLGVSGQIIAAGEYFLLVLAISWVFGREFADGTLKDMLAVPVQRSSILMAKFIVVAAWSVLLTAVIFTAMLAMGVLIQFPGGSLSVVLHGSGVVLVTACLVIGVVMPFAFFASVGRGYLLPIGMSVLSLMAANLVVVIGRGEYFPWAVPMLYAQGKSALAPVSFWVVIFTSLAGMLATYLWWKHADQNR